MRERDILVGSSVEPDIRSDSDLPLVRQACFHNDFQHFHGLTRRSGGGHRNRAFAELKTRWKDGETSTVYPNHHCRAKEQRWYVHFHHHLGQISQPEAVAKVRQNLREWRMSDAFTVPDLARLESLGYDHNGIFGVLLEVRFNG